MHILTSACSVCFNCLNNYLQHYVQIILYGGGDKSDVVIGYEMKLSCRTRLLAAEKNDCSAWNFKDVFFKGDADIINTSTVHRRLQQHRLMLRRQFLHLNLFWIMDLTIENLDKCTVMYCNKNICNKHMSVNKIIINTFFSSSKY